MDNTLLQQPRLAAQEINCSHEPDTTEAEVLKPYRELTIDAPQPPLRLKFDPPHRFDGQEYRELIFDFDGLIGKDFQRAEREFWRRFKPADKNEVVMPEMKHLYHCILAAHVAQAPGGEGQGVKAELIMSLPRRYYTPLRTEVLKACGSSSEEESE